MRFVKDLNDCLYPDGCVVTIGNFDGIHKGHQKILEVLGEQSQHFSLPSCVVSFDPMPAEYFAQKVGIDKVYAEVLPADKARVIEELQNDGNSVVMIGDGINDAPALAMADVGMALGSGTDVAMETSDIVILRNNLNSVFNVWELSQAVMNKIKQNLFWAFSYNIIGIPIAMGLLYPINDNYLLNPMFAGMAMAFSSVSVVVNTLLLRGPIEK